MGESGSARPPEFSFPLAVRTDAVVVEPLSHHLVPCLSADSFEYALGLRDVQIIDALTLNADQVRMGIGAAPVIPIGRRRKFQLQNLPCFFEQFYRVIDSRQAGGWVPPLDLGVKLADTGVSVAGRQDFERFGPPRRDGYTTLNKGGTHLFKPLFNSRVCDQKAGSRLDQ